MTTEEMRTRGLFKGEMELYEKDIKYIMDGLYACLIDKKKTDKEVQYIFSLRKRLENYREKIVNKEVIGNDEM